MHLVICNENSVIIFFTKLSFDLGFRMDAAVGVEFRHLDQEE